MIPVEGGGASLTQLVRPGTWMLAVHVTGRGIWDMFLDFKPSVWVSVSEGIAGLRWADKQIKWSNDDSNS